MSVTVVSAFTKNGQWQMNQLSEVRMEQAVICVVAVIAIGCATYLGTIDKEKDTTTVITSVVTGLFGYAGSANRNSKTKENNTEE